MLGERWASVVDQIPSAIWSPIVKLNLVSLRTVVVLLAAALLGACATQTQPGDRATAVETGPAAGSIASEAAVMARSQERWKALIERRFIDAYAYLSPGYRELTRVDDYVGALSSRPVKWESADVSGATCDGDVCMVKVLMTYSLVVPQPGVGRVSSISGIEEQWLRLDGEWFHLPDES
jgi:hypothetical protein